MADTATGKGRFAGRVAFVTGGDGRIGTAICKRLAAEGAAVAVGWVGTDSSHADALIAELKETGTHPIAVRADVTDPAEIQGAVQTIIETLGGIHIVVNNAGCENPHDFLEMPYDAWQGVLDVNLTGPFLVSQAAGRWMAQNGGGVIINISSVHDIIPWATYAHYCASKAGLSMLTKCMAVALADKRIRVVTIAPGAIGSSDPQEVWDDPELLASLLEKIPWGRIGRPEDVANAVAFVAGDEAGYITGTTIYVDGAMTQYPEFQHGMV